MKETIQIILIIQCKEDLRLLSERAAFSFSFPCSLPPRFLIIFSSSLIVSQYWPPQHTAPADQRKRAHKLQGKEKYEESMTRTYSASE